MKNELALIRPEELSLVKDNALNADQLKRILVKTPEQYIKKRPAKGGGQWDYVTGGYIKKCLNLLFGWDWSFEIVDDKIMAGEAIVKGKLTCHSNGRTIVKMQFGNKDVIYKKESDKDGNRVPLSIGNDLKAAATDALKKCAAEIGIAADIYNKEDFREIHVDTTEISLEAIIELFNEKGGLLSAEEQKFASDTIHEQISANYTKLHKLLKSK
jgi:hypothetical protein